MQFKVCKKLEWLYGETWLVMENNDMAVSEASAYSSPIEIHDAII